MDAEQDRIRNQALAWSARVAGEAVTDAEREDFERWRQSDVRHREAFEQHQRLLQAAAGLRHLEHLVDLRPERASVLLRAKRARARTRILFATAATVLLAVGAFALQLHWSGRYSTDIGEVRDVRLADGSVVTLGAHSSIEVALSRDTRRVTLKSGQAFFAVAHDVSRPFFVDAGDVVVRVVGTQFDVSRGPEGRVRVDVLQGKVQVTPSVTNGDAGTALTAAAHDRVTGSAIALNLLAGDRVLATPQQIPVKLPDPAVVAAGAWRSGRLSYASARLVDVVDDLNRYYGAGIVLKSPSLADMSITTSFRVENLRQFLLHLPSVLPVEVTIRPDGAVWLQASAPALDSPGRSATG